MRIRTIARLSRAPRHVWGDTEAGREFREKGREEPSSLPTRAHPCRTGGGVVSSVGSPRGLPRPEEWAARRPPLARLCGEGSEVTMPWRSASRNRAGVEDRAGRTMAYTQRGVAVLCDSGWLVVETTGSKRGARTTWRLTYGERDIWHDWTSAARSWTSAPPDLCAEVEATCLPRTRVTSTESAATPATAVAAAKVMVRVNGDGEGQRLRAIP